MPPLPKPGILDIAPYTQGASKASNNKPVIKLSSNESPLGASPRAYEALTNLEMHRYYDGSAADLRHAIAKTYSLDADRIVCGTGSDEIIGLLCKSYAGIGDEVIYTEHGFLMYSIYARSSGATPVVAKEVNLRADIQSILDVVTDKTTIIFIANPNNPTGSYLTTAELKELRTALPEHVLLVIDGAYAEYVDREDYSNGQELVEAYDNVVMTRTFSKIYGLAALRLGWGYCPPAVADVLNRVRGPFNVSGPALLAGIAVVEDQAFITKAKAHNDQWLPWLSAELEQLGFKVYPSVGNFILVECEDAQAVNSTLLAENIIIRPVANYGLPDCVRITVGTEDENQRVVNALR